MAGMTPEKALRKFGGDLLELKMNDPKFVRTLEGEDFFAGTEKERMLAKPTQADRADFFLDDVIKPGVEAQLPKLLNVMENYDKELDGDMYKLAQKIKKAMGLSKDCVKKHIINALLCYCGITVNATYCFIISAFLYIFELYTY